MSVNKITKQPEFRIIKSFEGWVVQRLFDVEKIIKTPWYKKNIVIATKEYDYVDSKGFQVFHGCVGYPKGIPPTEPHEPFKDKTEAIEFIRKIKEWRNSKWEYINV